MSIYFRVRTKLTRAVRFCEGLTAIVGVLLFILAVLTAIPFTRGEVKARLGALYGVTGAVYYEVNKNGNPSFGDKGGALFLLKSGPRSYDDLRRGDIFQAGTETNFRTSTKTEGQYTKSPKIFVLNQGECVVMLSALDRVETADAASAGWIEVATTACGLFQ